MYTIDVQQGTWSLEPVNCIHTRVVESMRERQDRLIALRDEVRQGPFIQPSPPDRVRPGIAHSTNLRAREIKQKNRDRKNELSNSEEAL